MLLGEGCKDGRLINLRRLASHHVCGKFPRGGDFGVLLEKLRERLPEINFTLLGRDPGSVDSLDAEVLHSGPEVKRDIAASL